MTESSFVTWRKMPMRVRFPFSLRDLEMADLSYLMIVFKEMAPKSLRNFFSFVKLTRRFLKAMCLKL